MRQGEREGAYHCGNPGVAGDGLVRLCDRAKRGGAAAVAGDDASRVKGYTGRLVGGYGRLTSEVCSVMYSVSQTVRLRVPDAGRQRCGMTEDR